jgi:phosphoglucomutase
MAIALADEEDISLVLANDPDADRFCAAERDSTGQWHIFTGNEMGIILAQHVLSQYKHLPNFDLRISSSRPD